MSQAAPLLVSRAGAVGIVELARPEKFNSLSIAFGNFRAGYVIAVRSDTRILRDPYTNKPFVYFYATKRVGGTVSNSEAIKVMKFAVS
mgnify:CR=1 FL=1